MVFNNETNKIDENIDKNMTKTYNHNNSHSGNNFKHFKLISFFINNS